MSLPKLGYKLSLSNIGHVINLNIYFKKLDKNQLTIVDHTHTPLVKFEPLTSIMETNTPTIKPPQLSYKYITLHSIYQILQSKHYKNISFESSYLIEILFK